MQRLAWLLILACASTVSAAEGRVDHHGNLLDAAGEFVHTNPLIFESSPYLRQHAHNPVQWLPWGEAALAKAKKENKPIFLSIGYATCHWCHVMARESFSDEQVAAMLNGEFVPIKVDREERPDIDDVYMAAVQIMQGRGGWPASLWLTPDGEPFDGGTYFRREAFLRKLEAISIQWREEQPALRLQAGQIAERVRSRLGRVRIARRVGDPVITAAVDRLVAGEDVTYGGWNVPKFPQETTILYLLGRWEREGDPQALISARRALDGMQAGGIHDQIGGGFSRYSVDAAWTTPHFEKMLYNQAWLGRCYLEAYRLTGDERYRRTAEAVLEYVRRDMTAQSGGFYSAEDADSEGEEGLFYVWKPAELTALLGPAEGALASAWFGVRARGNFPEVRGATILTARQDPAAFAASLNLSDEQFWDRIATWRTAMTAERAKRVRPERDEKILTDWNGFFIGTLARAASILGDPEYAKRAAAAARFLLSELRDSEGRLLHSWTDGKASVPAFLDDFASLSLALLELHEATGRSLWLEESKKLHAQMRAQFLASDGAFTRTGPLHEQLLTRSKDAYDGAYPSGNGLAAWSAVKLWRLTGDIAYRDEVDAIFPAFGPELGRAKGAAFLMGALDERMRGESGNIARDESGVVRVSVPATPFRMQLGTRAKVALTIDIAKGWHLAAIGPVPEGLKETSLSVFGALRQVDLAAPPGRKIKLPFIDTPARLWEGRQDLQVELSPMVGAQAGPAAAAIELSVQACDATRCLMPERLRVELPVVLMPPASSN